MPNESWFLVLVLDPPLYLQDIRRGQPHESQVAACTEEVLHRWVAKQTPPVSVFQPGTPVANAAKLIAFLPHSEMCSIRVLVTKGATEASIEDFETESVIVRRTYH